MKYAGMKFAIAAVAALVGGCGLKGPLYLPDEKKEPVATESSGQPPSDQPTDKRRRTNE